MTFTEARRANFGEGSQPRDRVVRVSTEELRGLLHRPACAPVLVAEVRLVTWLLRKVEVEVGCQPRRSGRAREDDLRDVPGVLVERIRRSAIREQLAKGERCVPAACPLACAGRISRASSPRSLERPSEGELERREPVLRSLHARKEAVERRDVTADRSQPIDVRLHERRPGARERVVDARSRRKVARDEHLDQLRNELAEVRVERVNVLRPLGLRQRRLRPGELRVDRRVEGLLGS